MVSETPMLTQDPLTRGREAQFRSTGVNSDEVVALLFSSASEGDGPCSTQLGRLCVDLLNPAVFGEATAETSGTAMLIRTIPVDAPIGHTISIQAVVQ
jgi:hypothetical protein